MSDLVFDYFRSRGMPEYVEDFKSPKEIPVHLHVPKCGGTFIRKGEYTILRLLSLSVYKSPPVDKMAIITLDTFDTAHLVIYCIKNAPIPSLAPRKVFYDMGIQDLVELLAQGLLSVFSITVTPRTVLGRVDDLNKIKEVLPVKFKWFTVARDPFQRALSMYYVLKDRGGADVFWLDKNEHSAEEFSEFLRSPYCDKNWASRFLAYVFGLTGFSPQMNPEIFEQLLQTMKTENVTTIPMGQIGSGLDYVFSQCYSPYIGNLATVFESNSEAEAFNRTHKPIKFKPDDVVEACLQEFKNANSYDIALFEKIVPFTG